MPRSTRDPSLIAAIDDLIRQVDGDPTSFDGGLIRELIQTGLRLHADQADTGELKLCSRSLRELRYAMNVFRPYRARRKISVFGSARTNADQPEFQAAVRFCRELAEAGWMVITGAGEGIMGAGNEGAGRENSFGVGIRLPFETNANPHIKGDPKFVMFRYFFTRKLLFVSQAHALALFPGGFGTLDEAFEVLTLVQTGKAPMMPIVMIDAPGGDYWKHWDHFVQRNLLHRGMISPEDLHLYYLAQDADDAVKHVLSFYRNYHSHRHVGDRLVLRIHKPLTDAQLDELNRDYQILVASGAIEQHPAAIEGETTFLDLPRIAFVHTRHGYGRLRMMIDRINQMGDEPTG